MPRKQSAKSENHPPTPPARAGKAQTGKPQAGSARAGKAGSARSGEDQDQNDLAGDLAGVEFLSPLSDVLESMLEEVEVPVEEPDPQLLSMDLEDLEKDDTLELLVHPNLSSEMGEDPVRLYLKEIGEIQLLDIQREFWLATRIEASHHVEVLSASHPVARRDDTTGQSLFLALYEELVTAWNRLIEDTTRLSLACPDFMLIVAEAQMLRHVWDRPLTFLSAHLSG